MQRGVEFTKVCERIAHFVFCPRPFEVGNAQIGHVGDELV